MVKLASGATVLHLYSGEDSNSGYCRYAKQVNIPEAIHGVEIGTIYQIKDKAVCYYCRAAIIRSHV